MASSGEMLHVFRTHPAMCALGSVVVPFVALYVAFEPLWETNDDVAMSMAAHGYGLAAYSSPHLIFSNVVWGHS